MADGLVHCVEKGGWYPTLNIMEIMCMPIIKTMLPPTSQFSRLYTPQSHFYLDVKYQEKLLKLLTLSNINNILFMYTTKYGL